MKKNMVIVLIIIVFLLSLFFVLKADDFFEIMGITVGDEIADEIELLGYDIYTGDELCIVTGQIKNNAGYLLSRITVTANFYDKNNNYLVSRSEYIDNLPNTYTEKFQIIINDHVTSYVSDIEHVQFKIEAS